MKLILVQLRILAPFFALSLLFLGLEALFPQNALIRALSNGSDYLLLSIGVLLAAVCIWSWPAKRPHARS